jgi:hypothetical protein
MSVESRQRVELLKTTLHNYRRTGPLQTSVGSWEQGLTLPMTMIAGLIDDAESKEAADRVEVAARSLVLGIGAGLELQGRREELVAALEAYREASVGGRTLAGLIEERQEELRQNVQTLLKTCNSRVPLVRGRTKNEAERVQDNLIALRQMMVEQRLQAGTTKVKTKEPYMEEAQQLVSAIADGNEERAEYHADRLEYLRIEAENQSVAEAKVEASTTTVEMF